LQNIVSILKKSDINTSPLHLQQLQLSA